MRNPFSIKFWIPACAGMTILAGWANSVFAHADFESCEKNRSNFSAESNVTIPKIDNLLQDHIGDLDKITIKV